MFVVAGGGMPLPGAPSSRLARFSTFNGILIALTFDEIEPSQLRSANRVAASGCNKGRFATGNLDGTPNVDRQSETKDFCQIVAALLGVV